MEKVERLKEKKDLASGNLQEEGRDNQHTVTFVTHTAPGEFAGDFTLSGNKGIVEAVCISRKRGIVKKQRPEVTFVKNWGIKDDAHAAGDWHRQISILSGESIDTAKEIIPWLSHGAFGENIITRGIDVQKIQIGSRLKLGKDVVLEVTQIGKECHTDCAIRTLIGDCILPKEGIFAKVIEGGELATNCEVNFEDGDIRGDGVNIASRLESIAVAGGVLVSKEVHDQLVNQ